MPYALSVLFVVVVWLAIVVLNERHNLLGCDRFPWPIAKWAAYAWLGFFMVVIALAVTNSALAQPDARQLETMPFYNVFSMHVILVVFLIGWWALSGAPNLKEFLNIRHERPGEVLAIGISVGVGAWLITMVVAMTIGLLLQFTGALTEPAEPPAMIGWMVKLAWWQKALIILSAMTVEEAFFRSFLQKRVGLVASTILFALAHFTYGNPLLLIGVTVVSLIIGVTFYRTKNVVPGVIAHGVFDAIQLYVIVPFAVRMMGGA